MSDQEDAFAQNDPALGKAPRGSVLSGYGQPVREGYRAKSKGVFAECRLESPTLGPSGSYLATPDLARNYGRSLQGLLGSTISLTYHIVP